jgi:hypothetical protein
VAKALVEQFPIVPLDVRAATRKLLPLAEALERREISERELVMAVEGPMPRGRRRTRLQVSRDKGRKAKR